MSLIKLLGKTNIQGKTIFDTGPQTPSDISGLQLWLDAADSNTLYDSTVGGSLVTTDGSAVARIEDKSGNARHLTQDTANARPILKTGIKNGKNVLRFDGSNDILTLSSSPIVRNTTGLTMFAVCKTAKALSGSQAIIHNSIGGLSNTTRATIYLTTTIEAGGRRLDSNGYQFVKAASMSTNEWVLAGSVHNYGSAALTAYKNGAGTDRVGGFQTAGSTPDTNSAVTSLGGDTYAPDYLNGDIAEVIIYNSVLTTSQRQGVELYLNNKWNLY